MTDTQKPDPVRLANELSRMDMFTEYQRGEILKAAAELRRLQAENEALRADAERLDWLLLYVSGMEFRRMGVEYSGNCNRAAIDAAMKEKP